MTNPKTKTGKVKRVKGYIQLDGRDGIVGWIETIGKGRVFDFSTTKSWFYAFKANGRHIVPATLTYKLPKK